MSQGLSDQEIAQRLSKLRNLEQAYPALQQKCRFLELENKALKAEIVQLKGVIAQQSLQIEKLSNTVEELQRIIFGRKSKPPKTEAPSNTNHSGNGSSGENLQRSATSYRRSIPAEDEITETELFTFSTCPHCGTSLSVVKTIVRYMEDLLPLLQWKKALKRVTKMLITTGYCQMCKKRVSPHRIAPQPVVLGENIKQFATFATIILRLSYAQVNDLLRTVADLAVSDGELDNILYAQADTLRSEYEQMKIRLNSEPANHYDETSWNVQKGSHGNYAWVKASSTTSEALLLMGRSRGKGNLDNLKGPPEQTGITDDYGAYRNAFRVHALCWAHPHRKFRDLTQAEYLTDSQRRRAIATYQAFAQLYQAVRQCCVAEFNEEQRREVLPALEAEFETIWKPHPDDPHKLSTLKESLRKNQSCYFVCVTTRGVPADNNKAERTLRHLVLKRKNSYGSKSQKGADASSILYSVLLSLWRTSKNRFFQEYQNLLEQTKTLQITASPLA